MTGRMIDELAARTAGTASGAVQDRLTRGAFAKRGLLGALALASLGRLSIPDRAIGAGCAGGSLAACDRRADGVYRFSLGACDEPEGSSGRWDKFRCYRETHDSWKKQRRACERGCPKPPKPHRPKPPSAQKTPKPPPSLPPNPYGQAIDDYCGPQGACEAAGGACCGAPTTVPGLLTCVHKSQCR